MRFRRYRDAGPAYDQDGPAPTRRSAVGPARAVTTLLAAGAAGLLVYIASRIGEGTNGDYWAVYGLIAAAGLVMALSQLLGGWTKWGMPHLSGSVFLVAFVPVVVVTSWVVAAGQPDPNWLRDRVLAWSSDIHLSSLVSHLSEYAAVLGFGVGLVFGYTFDTAGPRRVTAADPRLERDAALDRRAADEPTAAESRETVVGRRTSTVDEEDGEPAPPRSRRRFLSRSQ